jgi:formate dehydrogenase maturation protein FdhE
MLRAALVTTLTNQVIGALAELPDSLNLIAMDPASAAALAAQWADEYTAPLLGSINQHTQNVVEKVIQTYRTTPGMTRMDVESLLAEAFGARRAELIAITETTRAQSQATSFYQAYLRENGIELTAVWSTNEDELVCPICGALNEKPESEWIETYPDGPPAHVRCRCHKRLVMRGELKIIIVG